MKSLYLIRHANAGWDNTWTSDFDRSLSDRGRQEAEQMSSRLLKEGVWPELIVSSPANRAFSTAEIFAGKLGFAPEEIVRKIEIYEGGPDNLARIVQSIPEDCRTVMLFGHNPVISMFSSWLAGKSMAQMEPCGIARIDLGKTKWKDARQGCGTAAWYKFPQKN